LYRGGASEPLAGGAGWPGTMLSLGRPSAAEKAESIISLSAAGCARASKRRTCKPVAA